MTKKTEKDQRVLAFTHEFDTFGNRERRIYSGVIRKTEKGSFIEGKRYGGGVTSVLDDIDYLEYARRVKTIAESPMDAKSNPSSVKEGLFPLYQDMKIVTETEFNKRYEELKQRQKREAFDPQFS